MSHKRTILAGALLGLGLTVALAAHQATQPRPGPGSGIVDVKGTVHIANVPDVRVANVPTVHVGNVPTVTIGGPGFLKAKGRYLVRWPAGEPETLTIAEVGVDGWVRVAQDRTRWVNISAAWSVEVLP